MKTENENDNEIEAEIEAETETEIETEAEAEIETETEIEAEAEIETETEIEAEAGAEIPPIKQIRKLLSDFEMRVPVWGLTVFTVDGYILAHRLFYDDMPDNIELAVSSMSAGLITISEDFIRLVDAQKSFRQVTVDAEGSGGDVSFSILLKHVSENVMMACIFPSNVQLGLVTFELENLSNEIVEIVNMWDVKLHDDTVT